MDMGSRCSLTGASAVSLFRQFGVCTLKMFVVWFKGGEPSPGNLINSSQN